MFASPIRGNGYVPDQQRLNLGYLLDPSWNTDQGVYLLREWMGIWNLFAEKTWLLWDYES